MIFDLFVAPEQRKMGGAPGAPPRPWQGLSDVALRRVKHAEIAVNFQIKTKVKNDFIVNCDVNSLSP